MTTQDSEKLAERKDFTLPKPEDSARLEQRVADALQFLPSRPDYHLWIRVIAAIGNTFDDETALRLLLSRFSDETQDQHRRKLQNRLGRFGIGSLFYAARSFGYTGTHPPPSATFPHSPALESLEAINFDTVENSLLYRFLDERIEEMAAMLEYGSGISRTEADTVILQRFPKARRERLYRIAVNNQGRNKQWHGRALTTGFQNRILTAREIGQQVIAGYALCCAILQEDARGGTYRRSDAWQGAELFAVDVDGGSTLQQAYQLPETSAALLSYPTPNHTPERHRFRLLFDLPFVERDRQRYAATVRAFITRYRGDSACSDPCRVYFGNTDATVLLIRSGEVMP